MENLGFENSDVKIVNKLFLIGNGFDLALGLKTSYQDFIFWYLKRIFYKSIAKKQHVKRKNQNLFYYFEDKILIIYNKTNPQFSELYFKFINDISDFTEFKNKLHEDDFVLEFKSKILEIAINKSSISWIDIEGVYFDLLKLIISEKNKDYISTLNSDLNFIKGLLKEYLSEINYNVSTNRETCIKYINQFIREIKKEDILESFNQKHIKSESYYFLNFNYTKTILNVLRYFRMEFFSKNNYDVNIQVSRIHGDLDSDEIIFGFGDEIDENYKKIEELNDNRFFDNIKSFKYAEYPEYRNLLRFLNSNEYQVVIYGHSCGLSDRLLLNEVFEHENCKSIKIHFYNKEEFVQKTMNISRHFKSNQLMRQKIVEFDEGNEIPQIE